MIYRVTDIRNFSETKYEEAFEKLPLWRQEKAQKLKCEEDRKLSVFAFSEAFEMLCEFLSKNEREIELYPDEKGKLRVRGEAVNFSISHSFPYVAVVVSEGESGIDIECPREVSRGVLRRALCPEELSYVTENTETEQILSPKETEKFLRVWTMKEAYLKFTGEGLSGGLKSINTINENGEISLQRGDIKSHSEETDSYTLSLVWQAGK